MTREHYSGNGSQNGNGKPKKPKVVIEVIEGEAALNDPHAAAVMRAINKQNCTKTLEVNAERVAHFKKRIAERGMTPQETVIVVLNVDDVHGGPLADILMPGYNWQEIRERGEIPFARGLAGREGIEEAIGLFDKEAAEKLKDMADQVAVVVVDHGVAEIFPA